MPHKIIFIRVRLVCFIAIAYLFAVL